MASPNDPRDPLPPLILLRDDSEKPPVLPPVVFVPPHELRDRLPPFLR